jgi:hypothetical protein
MAKTPESPRHNNTLGRNENFMCIKYKDAAKKFAPFCDFYVKNGFFRHFEGKN